MARGRRNKEPSPEVEEEQEEEQQVEETVEETIANGTRHLRFNKPLNWPAGKAIPVAELLRRLETLCKELVSLDQEVVSRESLTPKAQELASKQLLHHKDNGVKAYALWCIVEMFRLLAPDAPYKESHLKDIFNLFVSHVVPALAHPDDPYNGPHVKILESLAAVRSIVLLADIPGTETLMLSLFTNCFDVLASNIRGSGEQLSKNVAFSMTAMLNHLIEESDKLSSGVIDILLAQFLRADPNLLAGGKKADVEIPRDVSPAYNMAKSVVNSNEDKMARHIAQYFTSVLTDASEAVNTTKPAKAKGKKRTRDESDDESELGMPTPPADIDLDEIAKAHRLLRELWRSCPEAIRGVIDQIEQQLNTEHLQLRVMAVQTVGDMVAGIGAAGPPPPIPLDPAAWPPQSLETSSAMPTSVLLTPAAPHAFPSVYPEAYAAFNQRHLDKTAQVRSAWAAGAGRIIQTSAGGKGLESELESSLLNSFAGMLADNDERVRLAAVQAVSDFDFNSIVQKLCGPGGVDAEGSVMGNLATRARDPKQPVRAAAIELLAKIWGVAAGAIVEGREYVRELFKSIPNRIFEAWYVNDRALNVTIQRALYDSLLPVGYPPIKSKSNGDSQRVPDSQGGEERAPDADRIRAERMLILLRDLDARTKKVFFSFQTRRPVIASYLTSMIEAAESGGDDNNKRLEKMAAMLAQVYPEPSQSAHHFEQFFELQDKRNFSLLKFCISPDSDYRKVVNATKELIKRLEQAPTSIGSCLESFVPLLRSASVLVYNRSHVPPILVIARTDDKGLAVTAHEILKDISSQAPKIFAIHVNDLCDTLKKQAPSASSENDVTAVDSLKACAGFARAGHFPADISKDRTFYQAMVKFAVHGNPPRASKHAVTITVRSAEKKEMYIKEILKACIKNFKAGEGNYLSKLAALGQLRLLANDEVSDQDDAITEIATTILTESKDIDDMDTSNTADADSELSAKLLALKCMVNALRGQTSEEAPLTDAEKDLANKVFKLLNTLIAKEGKLKERDSTSENHQAQLRLAAAKLILKLCCNKYLDLQFSPVDFNRLTRIAQDEKLEVRSSFNAALRKYLSLAKLRSRFYSLLFLYAHEPEKVIIDRTTTFVAARSKQNDQVMMGAFGFFISVLAHHPDFVPAAKDLEDFVVFILFYLRIVATEENLPAVYAIAQRIKTVEDGIDPDKSENLYVLSDLSEAVMRIYADLRGWSLQIVGGRAKLPSGIFVAPSSSADMDEIKNKRFLPDELVENLEDLVKDILKPKKRKATDESKRAAKKARTSTASTAKTDRPRKAAKSSKVSKPAKTPKKRAADALPSSERRKSSRAGGRKSYAENEDSEDDEELEQWQASAEDDEEEADDGQSSEIEEEEAADDEANKENVGSSTPPTSDPTPASGRKPTGQRATPQQKKVATARPTKAAAKASTKAAATKKPPARGGRTTRAAKKDVFDIEESDDEVLSDAPSEMEA